MTFRTSFYSKPIAFFAIYLISFGSAAQENLPVGFSQSELMQMQRSDWQTPVYNSKSGITTPPPGPIRNYAQWEETQAITITWTNYTSVLREIVREASASSMFLGAMLNMRLVRAAASKRSGSARSSASKPVVSTRAPPVNTASVWKPMHVPWLVR